jgi:acetoin utilization protein AcuC
VVNHSAKLIASYSYRGLRYTPNHPLRIPRVSLLLEFLKAMELLGDEEWMESRPAQWEELTLFHEEEYLLALQRADQEGRVGKEVREKFH